MKKNCGGRDHIPIRYDLFKAKGIFKRKRLVAGGVKKWRELNKLIDREVPEKETSAL